MSDIAQGIVVAALVLAFMVTTSRQDRYIRYLKCLAGDRDYWNTRCHHCRQRMRDANSIADVHPGPVPSSTVHTVWHMDRTSCARAAQQHADDPRPPAA